MGNISGSVVAKCKECNCVISWHIDSMPFVDSEITGTCSKCINKESHNCYDEFDLTENNIFKKVGRKEFNSPLPTNKNKEEKQ